MGALQTSPLSQETLLERLHAARKQSDELFSIVKPEFLYERPIAERHRIVFYIGHLEAFDWNLLRERGFQGEPFNPNFDRLFAFGIDPVAGGLASDQPNDPPNIQSVGECVAHTRRTIDDNLSGHFSKNTEILLNVAIEHRLMHAETLAYMLHQLPYDRKQQLHSKPLLVTDAVTPSMVEIPSGTATLGLSRDDVQFGWDNEYEINRVEVPPFTIDKYMDERAVSGIHR